MKTKSIVIAVALLSAAATTRAQVFDMGYTFTYYFPTLPSYHSPTIIPETGFYLSPADQPVTATIEWDIFDSLPSGAPVHSGIWHPGDTPYAPLFDQTWLDGEGSFRITILSGSQMISNCHIYVARFDGPRVGFTVYEASILPAPVPEPGTFAFLTVGLALAGVWRNRPRT